MMTQRDIFVSRQSSGYTRPLFIRPYVEVLCLCLEAEKWTTRLLMRIFDGRESLYGFPCRQIKFASLVPQTSMTYWSDLVRLSFWAGARSVHPVWLTTATLDLLYLLSSLVRAWAVRAAATPSAQPLCQKLRFQKDYRCRGGKNWAKSLTWNQQSRQIRARPNRRNSCPQNQNEPLLL